MRRVAEGTVCNLIPKENEKKREGGGVLPLIGPSLFTGGLVLLCGARGRGPIGAGGGGGALEAKASHMP